MFYRFGGALVLLVLIALGGIAIEKRNLTLRRAVSHQKFRQEVLLEEHAVHRLTMLQAPLPFDPVSPGHVSKNRNWPTPEGADQPQRASQA